MAYFMMDNYFKEDIIRIISANKTFGTYDKTQ